MDREQDVLADLFYETMGGTRYLYTHHPALLLRSREKEWYLPCRERYFMVILKMESPGECLALQFINVDSPVTIIPMESGETAG